MFPHPLDVSDNVYDTKKLSERIAKLAGGVAVIKVGAVASSWPPAVNCLPLQ
jgi:hypothetical protein